MQYSYTHGAAGPGWACCSPGLRSAAWACSPPGSALCPSTFLWGMYHRRRQAGTDCSLLHQYTHTHTHTQRPPHRQERERERERDFSPDGPQQTHTHTRTRTHGTASRPQAWTGRALATARRERLGEVEEEKEGGDTLCQRRERERERERDKAERRETWRLAVAVLGQYSLVAGGSSSSSSIGIWDEAAVRQFCTADACKCVVVRCAVPESWGHAVEAISWDWPLTGKKASYWLWA